MTIDEVDITRFLNTRDEADGGLDALMPLVYERIKVLALSQLRQQAPAPTLSATMLVNEAYVRLSQSEQTRWEDRRHFFAVATTVMRRIIIDYVRRSHADKRGGDERPVSLEQIGDLPDLNVSESRAHELMMLDEALDRLSDVDQRAGAVVEYRVFAGFTFDEVAEMLSISAMTAKRDWRFASAWLKTALSSDDSDS